MRDEGFDITIKAGHLLMKNVPYVNAQKQVLFGTIVSELSLNADVTIPPNTHVVQFIGELPCDSNGARLEKLVNGSGDNRLAEDLVVNHSFSSKPPEGYPDYYVKMTTYAKILTKYAQTIDPSVTAQPFNVATDTEDTSTFHYTDTASSRAEIVAVSEKLKMENIAIIGTGGNGGYIVDLVAKTPVRFIHLYDGDWFYQHNAFRAPGAPSLTDLEKKMKKVDYFASIYSKMHRGIVAHPYYVTPENIQELRNMDFVFLCLDNPEAKKYIVDMLIDFGVPFTDTGMGLYLADGKIGGLVRTTSCTEMMQTHIAEKNRIPFGKIGDANEYTQNIQIADLNALNAVLAVIRWKKFAGFYHDFEHEHFSLFHIDGNIITNDDKP